MTERPPGEGWSTVGDEPDAPALPEAPPEPAERWRRWEPPALIEDSLTDVVVEEGRLSRAADVTWSKEVIDGRIKAGYQCLKCCEPQETPFPEACSLCGYPMKSQQSFDFLKEFQGDKWLGPKIPIDEELAALEEKSERKAHQAGSSIVVPNYMKPR